MSFSGDVCPQREREREGERERERERDPKWKQKQHFKKAKYLLFEQHYNSEQESWLVSLILSPRIFNSQFIFKHFPLWFSYVFNFMRVETNKQTHF